jgi:hypothetical protein
MAYSQNKLATHTTHMNRPRVPAALDKSGTKNPKREENALNFSFDCVKSKDGHKIDDGHLETYPPYDNDSLEGQHGR